MPEILAVPAEDGATQNEKRGTLPSNWAGTAFAITIFLSAFLLFQVQLILGKYLLPFFGGTASVWNTCMFCFQVLLLLAYGYAHVLKEWSDGAKQRRIHSALLFISAAMMLVLWFRWSTPLTPGATWKPVASDNPVLKILELLGVVVALPFFVLSTTGPLLQS